VFGRHSCSHLMLFTTDDKLYSWNLINFAGMLSVHCNAVYYHRHLNFHFTDEVPVFFLSTYFLQENLHGLVKLVLLRADAISVI